MKLSYAAVAAFLLKFNKGEFDGERLGQAFHNTFKLKCTDADHADNQPCIFYDTDAKRVIKQIWGRVE